MLDEELILSILSGQLEISLVNENEKLAVIRVFLLHVLIDIHKHFQ